MASHLLELPLFKQLISAASLLTNVLVNAPMRNNSDYGMVMHSGKRFTAATLPHYYLIAVPNQTWPPGVKP